MKKSVFILALTVIAAGLFSFIPASSTLNQATGYSVDVVKSKIDWSGAAGDHYHIGSVNLKGGQVSVDNGKITGGKFSIDLTTIKSDAGERLDGHLKSPDFFDAVKFGEATYEIKSVKYTSDNTADIDGTLTIKGVSVAVKFSAKVRGIDDKKLFAEASFSFDRTLFGVNYGPGKVANDVAVNVHLFATK